MFVALVPPDDVLEDLSEFLAPRQEAEPGFRWTVPDQWHLTLAFMAQVADRHLDDLVARLERAASRRTPFSLALAGGGAFPGPVIQFGYNGLPNQRTAMTAGTFTQE